MTPRPLRRTVTTSLDATDGREARTVDPTVMRQVSEADVGPTVVVVLRAVGPGKSSIVFALTRGEGSRKALRSHTTRVDVS